jgi:hypothetical protein
MAIYDGKCPTCGEVIPKRAVPAQQEVLTGFSCPGCGRRLRTARIPDKLTYPITVAICALAYLLVGFRGWIATLFFLFALFPVYLIVCVAIGLVFPPPLELFPGGENPPSEATRKSSSD